MARTTLLIPFVLTLCLISVSCTSLPAAKNAVISFKGRMEEKDFEGAKKFASESFAKKIDGYKQFASINSGGTPSASDYQAIAGDTGAMSLISDVSSLTGLTFASIKSPIAHYAPDSLKGEIQKDSARIWNNDEEYIVYILIKEKGRWVMNGFDLSKLGAPTGQPPSK